MVVLGLLGVAVGATITDPATGDTPSGKAMGIGAGIWWILSGILALLAGGWATGRLAGLRRRWEAPLHGLVTWAVTTTAMLFLMSSAVGSVVSGAFRLVDSGARFVDRGAVTERARAAVESMDRADDRRDRGADRDRDGDKAAATGDSDRASGSATMRPVDEAEARAAAQTATDAVATAAWCTFGFLLLTAAAAAAGALGGAPHRGRANPTTVATVRTAPTLPGT